MFNAVSLQMEKGITNLTESKWVQNKVKYFTEPIKTQKFGYDVFKRNSKGEFISRFDLSRKHVESSLGV